MPNLPIMSQPSRRRRRASAAAVVAGGLLALTACGSSPDPADQAGDVTVIADHMIGELEEYAALSDVHVVDDESEAVPCGAGRERFRRLVVGESDQSEFQQSEAVVDGRLDNVTNDVYAALSSLPLGDYYSGGWDGETDEPAPRQIVVVGADGDGRGASMTVDLFPREDGWVTVRLEVQTACA